MYLQSWKESLAGSSLPFYDQSKARVRKILQNRKYTISGRVSEKSCTCQKILRFTCIEEPLHHRGGGASKSKTRRIQKKALVNSIRKAGETVSEQNLHCSTSVLSGCLPTVSVCNSKIQGFFGIIIIHLSAIICSTLRPSRRSHNCRNEKKQNHHKKNCSNALQ